MILSIESSCDDSSIALTRISDLKLIYHKKISQNEHQKYGGVVPELAARLHTSALIDIFEEVNLYFNDIKGVAITNSPGLSPSLLTGVSLAKAISLGLRVPLIEVNHLIGHIYSLFIEKEEIMPLGILLVSGGHTLVLEISKYNKFNIISSTLDDSFGESFDKVGKMLDLAYPAGEIIERLAKNGEDKFKFSIPLINSNSNNFSFSGLKNQVRLEIQDLKEKGILKDEINNICASFQSVAITHLINKLKRILKNHKFKHFGVVGGASANLALRDELENLGLNLLSPKMEFCSDNAAMIGRVGVVKYKNKDFINHKDLKIIPNLGYKKLVF